MTRQERYDELKRKNRLAVNCTDLDKTIKLIGSVGYNGDVYFPCDRCRKDHHLAWHKLLAVRQQWERENGIASEMVALREIVSEMSVMVVSDGMASQLIALQVRARALLKESGAA